MTREPLPRAARLLLRLSVPEDVCDQVIADLAEMWLCERAARSRLTSTLWLWREVLSFACRFAADRVRETVAARVGHMEVKLARRTIARTPLLTATAVASLAIGITLSASAFGVVSGLMFGHLDVPQGERVVQLRDVDRMAGWDYFTDAATFVRRRQAFRSVDLAAFSTASVLVESAAGSGRVMNAATLSLNALQVLRESPVAGRIFSQDDARAGDVSICMISSELAREFFELPSRAIGATLRVDGRPLTVIGVMRSRFRFPYESELWIPRAMTTASAAGGATLKLFGRLAPDATTQTASAEFAVIAAHDSVPGVAAEQMAHRVLGFTEMAGKPGVKWALWLCVVALVALMLVSAANVANLLLARAATRGFEFAIRAALGASRSRIAGQLVVEALFVAVVAAVAGALGARAALQWFRAAVSDLPYWLDLSLRWNVVLFIAAMATLATVVVAAVPASRVLRVSLAGTMKEGQSPVRFGRLSSVLIAIELAIAVGFIGGTSAVAQGLLRFGFGDSGIDGDRTLVAQLYFGQPPALQRPDAPTGAAERRRLWAEFESRTRQQAGALVERLRSSPLVQAAALGSHFPGNESSERVVEVEGLTLASARRSRVVEIGDGYVESLGSRVVHGRAFTASELTGSAHVVLVNESFVRRFALAPALGKRLRFQAATTQQESPWHEIVGVIPDLALNPGNLAEADGVYLPLPATNIARIAIRTRGNPAALVPLLHQHVLALDQRPQVQWSKTLSAQMAEPVILFRSLGIALTALGVIALVLAAAGVYALLALRVAQSRRELAVRLAIGARSWRLAQTVLARSAWAAVCGMGAGSIIAFGLTQLIATIPFDIEQRASIGAAGVLAVFGVIVLLGCAVPLGRTMRLRPVDLLKSG